MPLAYIPSPAQGVWQLGPIPVRAYALCIVAGIIIAVLITQKRWKARGGRPEDILDISLWAVPFGIVGGRIYHVLTDPQLYFAAGRERTLLAWLRTTLTLLAGGVVLATAPLTVYLLR